MILATFHFNFSAKRNGFFLFVLLVLLFRPDVSTAQIGSLRATFDDDLSQWLLYDLEENEIGELKWVSKSRDIFSEWKIYMNGTYGKISPKWRNDPGTWEASIGDELITIQQLWRNDITAWRITDNNVQWKLETAYKNSLEQWICSSNNGELSIFTQYEFDIRDWIIEDSTTEMSESMKAAIICFAIIISLSAS
jgi:hypothetical protein